MNLLKAMGLVQKKDKDIIINFSAYTFNYLVHGI